MLGGRRRRRRPLRRRQAHGGQVREERHGGRARLRPGVRPGYPVPRHAPSPGISDRHRRNHLVCVQCK
uniref:Uncharacterized protein n=1 Tax=Arundo donax TaxID=35708 RepID=A0A0A8XR53_ARUDO